MLNRLLGDVANGNSLETIIAEQECGELEGWWGMEEIRRTSDASRNLNDRGIRELSVRPPRSRSVRHEGWETCWRVVCMRWMLLRSRRKSSQSLGLSHRRTARSGRAVYKFPTCLQRYKNAPVPSYCVHDLFGASIRVHARAYCTAGWTATPSSCATVNGKSAFRRSWRARWTTSA